MEIKEISAGNKYYICYLVLGEKNALIDTGISGLGTYIIEEAKKHVETIDYLLLTHSHYDHCGSSHFIKEEIPEIRTCASKYASEILQKPSAIDMIASLGRKERDTANSSPFSISEEIPFEESEPDFDGLEVERVLDEGDGIDLGDFEINAIHAPGHTRGNLSYYSEELQAIFGGGAAEAPSAPSFLYDFDEHIESLEKLSRLENRIDARRISFGHFGSVRVEEGENYFQKMIRHNEKYKEFISMFLEKNNHDIDKTIEDIKAIYWTNFLSPRIEEAVDYNTRAQVENVAKLE